MAHVICKLNSTSCGANKCLVLFYNPGPPQSAVLQCISKPACDHIDSCSVVLGAIPTSVSLMKKIDADDCADGYTLVIGSDYKLYCMPDDDAESLPAMTIHQ